MASASQPRGTGKPPWPAAPPSRVPGFPSDEPDFPPDPKDYALGTPPVRWPDDPPPDPDGDPYPDIWTGPVTPEHLDAMTDARQMLKARYAHRADVYVTSEMPMYYWEGGKKCWVKPDLFVAFGVQERKRRVWLVQEEGKLADFILEVASGSTHERDRREKRAIYERLGVAEYWRFDLTGDYLDPVLQGLRRNLAGTYESILLSHTAAGVLGGASEVLGLRICADAGDLRLFDPVTGEYLLTNREEREGRLEERRRRLEAEAEVEELRRQLARRP